MELGGGGHGALYYYYFIVVNNNNNNNNNNKLPICYPGCLLTRQRHLQIRKEDLGPSIFTCTAHIMINRSSSG